MDWHWLIEKPRTRSELIITRGIQALVVFVLIIGCIIWINSTGADAAPITSSQTNVQRIPPHDPPPSTKAWAHHAIRKWHHHRHALHKSGGRIVPHKAVVRLESYKDRHPSTRSWWKKGLDLGQCMFNSIGSPIWTVAWQALCLTKDESPTFRHINENITAVRVLCGGAAVVGFLKGGGEWGAVKKSAACAFPAAIAIYEHWLDRPIHGREGGSRSR